MYSILQGHVLDRLRELPAESVQCVVTSPPYWGLRDYKAPGQLGLEKTLHEYIATMVQVFAELRRVLRKDGTLWLNMGDSYSNDTKWGGSSGGKNYTSAAGGYKGQRVRRDRNGSAGLKPKDLCMIPHRLAIALQDDGWWIRQDIVWSKRNPMPESVTDRPTRAHEYVFLCTKSQRYYYNADAIKEPSVTGDMRRPYTSQGSRELDGRPIEQWHGGELRNKGDIADVGEGPKKRYKTPGKNSRFFVDRDPAHGSGEQRKERSTGVPPVIPSGIVLNRNARSVWDIATAPFAEAHFATFPPKLVEPCILTGTRPGDIVLDPFSGSGTTIMVAIQHGRTGLGIELNPDYIAMAHRRIQSAVGVLAIDSPLSEVLSQSVSSLADSDGTPSREAVKSVVD